MNEPGDLAQVCGLGSAQRRLCLLRRAESAGSDDPREQDNSADRIPRDALDRRCEKTIFSFPRPTYSASSFFSSYARPFTVTAPGPPILRMPSSRRSVKYVAFSASSWASAGARRWARPSRSLCGPDRHRSGRSARLKEIVQQKRFAQLLGGHRAVANGIRHLQHFIGSHSFRMLHIQSFCNLITARCGPRLRPSRAAPRPDSRCWYLRASSWPARHAQRRSDRPLHFLAESSP